MAKISERAFEDAIECALLAGGPNACGADETSVAEPASPFGSFRSGGYRKRHHDEYDRHLCLIQKDLLDFIYATQPKEWKKLKEQHGEDVKQRFFRRVARGIAKRGALDVFRRGVRDSGCKFDLAYFRPNSGLSDESKGLYDANLFSVLRQLHYSESTEQSIDLGIFLNGIPVFTAELKNPLTGQNYKSAIYQYQTDRDPREPLLAYGRCLAHFAVDPHEVHVTTKLEGKKTRFLPFNQGWNRGKGNPPPSLVDGGYSTSYLWESVWSRDSVLDLIKKFVHEVEPAPVKGKKKEKPYLVFPRYHQLDAVRRMIADAKSSGAGSQYLIQHSAGSGKTFTIAWLAHQLSVLHDAADERVFDSIVVITDRRVLDRQLQTAIRQFEQTLGVVENIDKTSNQLKDALEKGKTIIVTTLQKFPVIVSQISSLPGKRFAVIVDEAHSSQSGESSKHLKAVLSSDSLESAASEEEGVATVEDEIEDRILEEIRKRGRQPNVSWFAFTATPKAKTMELFGTERPDGRFEPFSLYSMRQAIEEGFILDVLKNYTTYESYWKLLKTIEDDPQYDGPRAKTLLTNFVELSEHAIGRKVAIMVEHFHDKVSHRIKGKAKAMIVTRSRLHAVRFKLAVDAYIKEKGYPYRALVAFSGTVEDEGKGFTEANMNGFSDAQTALAFGRPEYQFMVVANKFQTGFDQPLLHTMYVDKKLGGVNTVQTLSRLNRIHPEKAETAVLDFANDADAIRNAFEPYFETTLLSEATDPNLPYEIHNELIEFGVFTDEDVDAFGDLFYSGKATHEQLYAALSPFVERFEEEDDDEARNRFRKALDRYARLYAFLAQILPFRDVLLEKLYVFCKLLWKLLPVEGVHLPEEVKRNVRIGEYGINELGEIDIALLPGPKVIPPAGVEGTGRVRPEDLEPLSQIIEELNARFGASIGEENRSTLEEIVRQLNSDAALDTSAKVNTRENVKLTFEHKLGDIFQNIIDSNFALYKRINDDEHFGNALTSMLFDLFLQNRRDIAELLKLDESLTLEFKSSLRWNLKEDRKDPVNVTHAVLKTLAAFMNTDGGDLLIGVADDKSVVGIEVDQFDSRDKFMLHLSHVVQNALGKPASTLIDPRIQLVEEKGVCLVPCKRSPAPVFLQWKDKHARDGGDFYVRSGPGSVRMDEQDIESFVLTRFA
ncbi:RNA-binding domain-containing protein [Bacteroidota bacterium]